METIKVELSIKVLLGLIAIGLFLNAFNVFPPKKVQVCSPGGNQCTNVVEVSGHQYLMVAPSRQ